MDTIASYNKCSSSTLQDIKQKLSLSQYVRPSLQEMISYPTLALGKKHVFFSMKRGSWIASVKNQQPLDATKKICIFYSINQNPSNNKRVEFLLPPRSMFEFLGHHQPNATGEAVVQSCARSGKIDASSNSWSKKCVSKLGTPRMHHILLK